MLKTIGSGIYRKLLILTVLSGSLFVVSSLNPVSALPCCSDLHCESNYDSCALNCNVYQGVPAKYAQCIGACEDALTACWAIHCDHGC